MTDVNTFLDILSGDLMAISVPDLLTATNQTAHEELNGNYTWKNLFKGRIEDNIMYLYR